MNQAMTYHRVESLGEKVVDVHLAGVDVAALGGLEGLFDALDKGGERAKIRERSEEGEDVWGRKLRWYCATGDGTVVVLISSNGKNGRPQIGGGDDISVRIEIDANGDVRVVGRAPLWGDREKERRIVASKLVR